MPGVPNACQSTQCWPGARLFRGMKVSPSSVFSQNAPSPRTRRWITRCCRSPRGIRSYTSCEKEGGGGEGETEEGRRGGEEGESEEIKKDGAGVEGGRERERGGRER